MAAQKSQSLKKLTRWVDYDPRLLGYYTTSLLKAIRDGYVHDLCSLAQFAESEGRRFSDKFRNLSVDIGTVREYKHPSQGALESLQALVEAQLVTVKGLDAALSSLRTLEQEQRAMLREKRRAKAQNNDQRGNDEIVEFPLVFSTLPPVTIDVVPNWQHIQKSLNISLTVLADLQRPGAIVACPPDFYLTDEEAKYSDVFVVMPLRYDMRPIYRDHIRNVCHRLSLSVSRADDFFTTSLVMADVWAAIKNAKVLVADCTGRNPNVFYEIGIAHVLGKEVILLAQKDKDIPFDIQHIRHIKYQYTTPGMHEFEGALERTLSNITAKYRTGCSI